jgi:hypothetical protein
LMGVLLWMAGQAKPRENEWEPTHIFELALNQKREEQITKILYIII